MPDLPIGGLPSVTTPNNNDLICIVDTTVTPGVTKNITVGNFLNILLLLGFGIVRYANYSAFTTAASATTNGILFGYVVSDVNNGGRPSFYVYDQATTTTSYIPMSVI